MYIKIDILPTFYISKMIDFFSRLDKYLENNELNDNKITKKAGLSNGIIGKARVRGSLSQENIAKILHSCQDLNANWLFTGQGDMYKVKKESSHNAFKLKTDNNIAQQKIPLYSIEATAGLIPLFDNHNQIETEEYISIPHVPRCDGALFVTGDSMYPLLKSGDIVAYQQVHDKGNYIFWGEMYLLSIDMGGEEYVSVKYVQKSEQGKEFIKLVSENRHHQPQDVHIDDIRALALVKASVRINSM